MKIQHPNYQLTSEEKAAFAKKNVVEVFNEIIVPKLPDPFTLPKVQTRCLKKTKILGKKVCIEWSVSTYWLHNTCYLVIDAVDDFPSAQVRKVIHECLREEALVIAVAALISAYTTGVGTTAAWTVVADELTECIQDKLADIDIVDMRIECKGDWVKV